MTRLYRELVMDHPDGCGLEPAPHEHVIRPRAADRPTGDRPATVPADVARTIAKGARQLLVALDSPPGRRALAELAQLDSPERRSGTRRQNPPATND